MGRVLGGGTGSFHLIANPVIDLEAGADDVNTDDGMYEVTTAPSDFSAVQEAFDNHGISRASEELAMLPSSYVKLEGRDAERCLGLMEKLEDHDDVQHVFTSVPSL